MQEQNTSFNRITSIIILVLAGESIFLLPFVLARIFRPTFLEVFTLTNTELGFCFSIYGIVALLSYLFGGMIADFFKTRNLIALALLLTATGGFYMSTIPDYLGMKILFGYWGFTTIFLFWAAMIKATRIWGGEQSQGKAFGFLDGGRGVVAAIFGVLGVSIFAFFIVGEVESATLSMRTKAFQYVIIACSIFVMMSSILAYYGLKRFDHQKAVVRRFQWDEIQSLLKIPGIWLLMVIILCAYVAYKLTDLFSLYAKEVMLYDEIQSAQVGIFLFYIRPIVGFTIGFLADRFGTIRLITLGFLAMILGSSIFIFGFIEPHLFALFLVSIFATAVGIYAIRALYFAAMKDGNIPLAYTGTAVGLMSLVGYTPDIFVGPIMGMLLDKSPGEEGHIHVFIMMTIFASIGLIASLIFWKVSQAQKSNSETTSV